MLQSQYARSLKLTRATASRASVQLRAAHSRTTPGRASHPPSRVPNSLSSIPALHARRRIPSLLALYNSRSIHTARSNPAAHLQSAFPTKTVIFLLVIGGLVYYFVDIEEPDWTDDVLFSYQEDQASSQPLHFNNNKEELDHYLQVRLPMNRAHFTLDNGRLTDLSSMYPTLLHH